MRVSRNSPFLSAAIAVSILTMGALAADSSTTTSALPNLTDSTTDTGSTTSTSDTATKTSTGSTTTTGAAAKSTTTTGSTTTSATKVTITGAGTTESSVSSIPSITGTATQTTGGGLTGLPTLSGAYTIVAPSVPPTANAPFMQQSKLPEGTVFIVVGAILGFLAMCVLLWRVMVAWSLHRSVKRAALAQHAAMADTKPLFRGAAKAPGPPPAPFYKYTDRESTISLSGLGPHGKNKKSQRPTTATGNANANNLFFSPTAGAAVAGLANSGNRGSSYLPAGYYAAGSAAAGNGQGHVSMGGHGPAISLSNLGPNQGYPRAMSVISSPESPQFMPSNRGHMASSSTLNLTTGYGSGQERAPSAYLDDLFDGENAPPVPGQHQRINSASPHRF